MNLQDLMSQHMDTVFTNIDGLAMEALLVPQGYTDAQGLTLKVIPADPQEAMETMSIAQIEAGALVFTASRTQARESILAITGVTRDLKRHDEVVFPAGSPHQGRWIIAEPPVSDEGGAIRFATTRKRAARGGAGLEGN